MKLQAMWKAVQVELFKPQVLLVSMYKIMQRNI